MWKYGLLALLVILLLRFLLARNAPRRNGERPADEE